MKKINKRMQKMPDKNDLAKGRRRGNFERNSRTGEMIFKSSG